MKLNKLFSDGVVLQRGKPIKIFGSGAGEATVTFRGTTKHATCSAGSFCLEFPAEEAGGPYKIEAVLNGEKTVVENVYVGDVYFVAGQSNMQFSFGSQTEPNIAITEHVRVFTVSSSFIEHRHECDDSWLEFRIENYPYITNVGIRFAALLSESLKIPVGIVGCASSGSVIESWIPRAKLINSGLLLPLNMRHNDALDRWYNGEGINYEIMFSTVKDFSYRAVLWYQGESNCKDTEVSQYGRLFELLVASWRSALKDDLPFFTVQLPPFAKDPDGQDWAGLRRQQEECAEKIDGVYMVTSGDNVDACNIHPHNKDVVAKRLFLAVKNELYGSEEEYRGPSIKSYRLTDGELTIEFKNTCGSLAAKQPITVTLTHDGKTSRVSAFVDGDTLVVKGVASGDEVSMANNNGELVYLTGKTGLPAVPFCITI